MEKSIGFVALFVFVSLLIPPSLLIPLEDEDIIPPPAHKNAENTALTPRQFSPRNISTTTSDEDRNDPPFNDLPPPNHLRPRDISTAGTDGVRKGPPPNNLPPRNHLPPPNHLAPPYRLPPPNHLTPRNITTIDIDKCKNINDQATRLVKNVLGELGKELMDRQLNEDFAFGQYVTSVMKTLRNDLKIQMEHEILQLIIKYQKLNQGE